MSSNLLPAGASLPRLVRSVAGYAVCFLLVLFVIATVPSLLAQSASSGASVLFPLFHEYLIATETHDLDKLQALSADPESKQQLERLKEVKDEKTDETKPAKE